MASSPTRSYADLHEHLDRLERAGLLHRIDAPVNKDTEMHPLVRWQFRGGIAEKDRKAFLFTNIVDSKGRRYDIPVVVGAFATNPEVYRIGMNVATLDAIGPAWERAIAHPIAPRVVETAPCHDVVLTGRDLEGAGHGLEALPIPISTPGFDAAPYLTATCVITRNPETGVQNIGTYRGQLKGPTRLGMMTLVNLRSGGYEHWKRSQAAGQKMPVAIVVGCPPVVAFQGPQKLPHEVDEISVAGALAGGPINVVRGRTVDLLVPAEAELVIEGLIDTASLEPEAPFGESHGYVNLQEYNAFMEVTAITRRHRPILTSFVSQVAPSESSVIRRVAMEPVYLHHLRSVLGIKGVTRVAMHEPLTSLYAVIAIQFARGTPETEIWRALNGASALHRFAGKWIIAVDEDIEPDNADALFWAMSYRCQPQHDLKVVPHKDPGHGPRGPRDDGESAAVLINATLKGPYAPIALPKREFMERARAIWERLGLPPLTPQPPWHGYDLGHWPAELERQAEMAVKSEYFELGKHLANERRSDVAMNTPVERD